MTAAPRGFSLIETLVAMLLLSLAILGIAPLFVFAKQSTAVAADIGKVGASAVQRMELLRQIPFENLTAGGSLTSNVTGFVDTSDAKYLTRWTVTDDATPPTFKTIQVRAMARNAVVGLPKQVELICVVTE